MKKLFVTVAVAVVMGLTSFAADITKVSQRVLAAFEKEFSTATNVSWEVLKSEDIYHASFVYSNEVMEVYYSADGDMIAVARQLSRERLPLLVSKSITENYGKLTFKSASEYVSAENTSYIVTLENEKSTVVVRVYNTGTTEVLKKSKKS
jgi:hypothetical protein